MADKNTNPNQRSIWNQRTDDYKSSDKETDAIFSQLTGSGIVSTENKAKGNNRRV